MATRADTQEVSSSLNSSFRSYPGLPGLVRRWGDRAAARFGARGGSALAVWRARTLAAMLGGTLVVGLGPLVLALWVFATNGLWPMIVVDISAYLAVAYVYFSRRPTFQARAWTVIAGLFAIGTLTMTLAGFRTAGAVWLSMAALFAGMLLGVRAGIAVVLANTALFVAFGVGIANDAVPWAQGVPNALQLWVMSAVNTAMLGLVAAVAVGVLLNGLEREAAARLRAEEERRVGRQLESLGTMAGGMAHDFNNLLAPILANVELLADDATPDQRELLDDIRTSAERGRDLVRRLMALRKGDMHEAETADLGTVVHEVARLVRTRAARGVAMHVTASASHVYGSCAELHQIVMNLATNAVQAMPDGGTLSLTVDEVHHAGRAMTRLQVCDTGGGMSPETLERAFDPFFTTKSPQEGTGLGLPTVRAIALSKGGHVELASAAGKGTTVTVTLPSAPRPAAAPPRPDGPLPLTTPFRPAVAADGSRVVLLVDDEPIVLETARRLLLAMGRRPVAVAAAADAEQWFRAHPGECDLVLTDHRMPRQNGIELVAALRQLEPALPAVVASGYVADAAAAARTLEVRVSYLAKPYGVTELRDALDDALAVDSLHD